MIKKYLLLFFIVFNISFEIFGQTVFSVIDSVNEKISNNYASFSYDVKVKNVKDLDTTLLDEGKLIVNNTLGKYDDFLYSSHFQKDTFCFVRDTLLKVITSSEIFKEHSPKILHVRLGTTRMFFRCFTYSFLNDKKLIDPIRWDILNLDKIDTAFFYISLYDTTLVNGYIESKQVCVKVNKNDYSIREYNYRLKTHNSLLNNIFTFSNWRTSTKINEDVNHVFERIRSKSNSSEYLANFPTRKMRLDNNKTVSLDDLTVIDSLNSDFKIGNLDAKFVVLYFWFKGCYHCKHVGPIIEKFHKNNNRKDIVYLGIDTHSKNKDTLKKSIAKNQYDFPNFRIGQIVKGLTINAAPIVIIYDNANDIVIDQIAGGSPEFEINFSKIINGLPIE